MGMCKECGEVVSFQNMTDGVCYKCAGILEETVKNKEPEQVQPQDENRIKPVKRKMVIAASILVALIVGSILFYVKAKEKNEIKKLASMYSFGFGERYSPDQIEILSSYTSQGREIQVLKIGRKKICEMPVIDTNNGLMALGITCKE